MKLASLLKVSRKPGRTLVLPREVFADTYENRPDGDVCIGLRSLSERDMAGARNEAVKTAARCCTNEQGQVLDAEAFVDTYNDTLVRWAVAEAMCDPNDVSVPFLGGQTPFG